MQVKFSLSYANLHAWSVRSRMGGVAHFLKSTPIFLLGHNGGVPCILHLEQFSRAVSGVCNSEALCSCNAWHITNPLCISAQVKLTLAWQTQSKGVMCALGLCRWGSEARGQRWGAEGYDFMLYTWGTSIIACLTLGQSSVPLYNRKCQGKAVHYSIATRTHHNESQQFYGRGEC